MTTVAITTIVCVTAVFCSMIVSSGLINAARALTAKSATPPTLTCDRCKAVVPDDGTAHAVHDTFHAWMDALAVEMRGLKR